MATGDTVYLTCKRLGSRALSGGRVEKCPACGRKGAASHYKDGSHSYRHVVKDRGSFWEVIDSCFVGTGASAFNVKGAP